MQNRLTQRARIERYLNDLGLACGVLSQTTTATAPLRVYPVRTLEGRIEPVAQKLNDLEGKLQIVGIRASYNNNGQICVEVPNEQKTAVYLSNLKAGLVGKLVATVGIDPYGKTIGIDLADAPHLLIGGATGSGKSELIKTIIASLIGNYTRELLDLTIADVKRIDYAVFSHSCLLLTDAKEILTALLKLNTIMSDRYSQAQAQQKSFEALNLARIVYVVEELDQLASELEVVSKDLRTQLFSTLQAITRLGRAAGIHLILATQKPSADVFPSIIKANAPMRICGKVQNHHESKATLEEQGAEKLAGKGDMLLMMNGHLKRFQAALVAPEDIAKACEFYKKLPDELIALKEVVAAQNTLTTGLERWIELAGQYGGLTINLLRNNGAGKNEATKIMKELRELGVIGTHNSRLGYSPFVDAKGVKNVDVAE